MHNAPESITEFLTDGSLAALCASLGELTHHAITLRDRSGMLIVNRPGDPPWVLQPDDASPTMRADIDALQTDHPARSASRKARWARTPPRATCWCPPSTACC